MEVKDINNSVNPLLFNKNAAVAASGQALGAGFASSPRSDFYGDGYFAGSPGS